MNHIKLFEDFNKEPASLSEIKAFLDYYAYPDKSDAEKARIQARAEKIHGKIKNVPHLVKNEYKNDGSPQIVYHSSGTKFTRFKTPAFFGTAAGAYDGDYDYVCVISIKNMLDLRSNSYKDDDEWLDLIRDIFKDSDLTDEKIEGIIDFAKRYRDAYGFFKLVSSSMFEPYRWDIVFDYMKKNGYDGAVLRESDQSINYYFDGYIVMEPNQIQVLAVKENDRN